MYYMPTFYPIHWCQKPAAGRVQVTPMVSNLAKQVRRHDTITLREALSKLTPIEQTFIGMYICNRVYQHARRGLVSLPAQLDTPGDT